MIKPLQAERLLQLVNYTRGLYEIPEGAELVGLFSSKGKKKRKMTERGARAVIDRLARRGCIRRKGGKRYINTDRVVTTMPSCLYLLLFHELCGDHRVSLSKRAFHRRVNQKYQVRLSKLGASLDRMYEHAVAGKYIIEVKTEVVMLEAGPTLKLFLPYLQRFKEGSKR